MSILSDALRRKSAERMIDEVNRASDGPTLKRSLGLFRLTTIGVGATVGTGIFFVLSQAVPMAGPAVILSFVIAALVAGLSALCYAEMAGAVPVAGSSYSYTYATLGELVAMFVGACLLLEYGVSAAAVTVGWSEYVNSALSTLFGVTMPDIITRSPEQGGLMNLPAMLLVAMCSLLLVRGTKESFTINAIMVSIKVGVLVMFVGVGVAGWNPENLAPFAPYGLAGVTGAAGVIFFSFIGLDTVSTAAEEVKNPRRTLPLAIIFSLIAVTVIYIGVAVVAVAAQPAAKFDGQEAGLAAILSDVTGQAWPGVVLSLGAVVSIFSITLVILYGQTRVLFVMSRDGLIPPLFSRLNRRTRTPVHNTAVVAVVVGLLAGFLPLDLLTEMTSVGTLVAFLVVSVGVIVLRRTSPNLPRAFKVPLYPIVPILSAIGCLWLIKDLRPITLIAFGIWSVIALVFYFAYGRRHSRLSRPVAFSTPEERAIDDLAVSADKAHDDA